jgi:opacity protein-like surface antigen
LKRFTILAGAVAAAGLLSAACAAEEPTATKVGEASQAGSVETTASTAKPAAPKQTDFKVGDKVEAKGNVITVYGVAPYTSDNQFMKPEAGMRWMAVDVEACAGPDAKDFSVNPFEFELQLADNTRAEPNMLGKDPSLNHTELSAGDCVRGFVSYEVPNGKNPVKFIYNEMSFFGGAKVKWAL